MWYQTLSPKTEVPTAKQFTVTALPAGPSRTIVVAAVVGAVRTCRPWASGVVDVLVPVPGAGGDACGRVTPGVEVAARHQAGPRPPEAVPDLVPEGRAA